MDFFKNPEKVIRTAKREKNINKTFVYQLLVSAIFAVSTYIATYRVYSVFSGASVVLAAICFVLGVLGLFIVGFLAKIVMNILGGKGKYFEGLTAIVYSMVAPSFGAVISVLTALVPGGVIIGIPVLIITIAIGYATFYRALKEFFRVDMITALIGTSVVTASIIIGMYIGIFLSFFSVMSFTSATTSTTMPMPMG